MADRDRLKAELVLERAVPTAIAQKNFGKYEFR
jgi:hypothetical protein